jgi:nitrite reductase/ring-hydroxylating ferredoxin subunit
MPVKLADLKDIPEGKSVTVRLDDGREIALFNAEGRIFALDNACPHMGGPLGEGPLDGFCVTCPWHGWEFDVRSGECINMPGYEAQPIDISVEEDSIYLKD